MDDIKRDAAAPVTAMNNNNNSDPTKNVYCHLRVPGPLGGVNFWASEEELSGELEVIILVSLLWSIVQILW